MATSNSILMITFANDQRREGLDAKAAALSAGSIRLRPVLMTALAMVLGMLPMALGFGEGGEQNAPLGRAVIGGLSIATLATLFFVPVVYSVLRRRQPPPCRKGSRGMNPTQAVRDGREKVEAEPSPHSGTLKTASVLAGLTFLGLFAIGVVPRLIRHRSLSAEAEAERVREPVVSIARAVEAPPVSEVLLPGSTQAIEDTGIYARTDGYLKARYVELGAEVKAGERLAEIATPEIDQQLDQAEANLGEAKSNVAKLEADRELAESTLTRYLAAGTAGGVSKQQIDERTSAVKTADKAVDAARATVNAQEANVRRLRQLQGFQQVVAPFDGVITARSVDPGALISSGSQNGELRSLFRIARTDVLRVLTYVPQTDAPFIKVHQDVTVTVREFPNRMFAGTVDLHRGGARPVVANHARRGARAESGAHPARRHVRDGAFPGGAHRSGDPHPGDLVAGRFQRRARRGGRRCRRDALPVGRPRTGLRRARRGAVGVGRSGDGGERSHGNGRRRYAGADRGECDEVRLRDS